MRLVQHALPSPSAGVQRTLRSLHYGRAENGRKVYIQASLHADEIPALLVAQHLREQLQALDDAGAIAGEIVLVPMANPIGLAQELQGTLFGRFDLATGINFNRLYKHLTPLVLPRLQGKLGSDAAANVAIIRKEGLAVLAEWEAQSETEALKKLLQTLATDADVVLDLHCDNEAVLHLYTGTPLAEPVMQLARRMGAEAVLLAKVSGDDPFDETLSRHWWELAEQLPTHPIPNACISVTVELRGEHQVEHGLARQDAEALVAWLQDMGHVAGAAPAQPAARCAATPLEGVEPLAAPHAGVIVFHKNPGEQVAAGELVAEVIDPATDQRSELRATVTGVLFARVARRYAARGMKVAKIAGAVAFRSGKLLSM
ncbi:succinylglutamate desuccinylase/aspartoacylase family protein [Pelomonas sp. SE-A7]|uniref:succinylglutamate desuccinylase/aspartoacylase family protein n=1 Tax=Pelomonas sp. SE-A7 TaxID=3054953 RepID=UPI00259CF652|nr:succinylglutamate desuccinylase/aspartoacylase family protein [Pelomonas sp. SE-A7]MDM4765690.1 M14 family metallopeptidase [Pelomonas sp. SE-A7]